MQNQSAQWFPLDNAGKIFPGQNTSTWANVFRVGIQLRQEVDPVILKEALDKTLRRFPTLNVRIRKGAFWYYFEKNPNSCPVNEDVKNFCYRVNYEENNGFLLRVFYYKNTVSVDFYHALCDGYGGTVFVSTLVGEYLRMMGNEISYNRFVLDVDEEPRADEIADAYKSCGHTKMKYSYPSEWVYHRRGTMLAHHMTNYTIGTMPFSQLHALSKKYSVTVTELLSALLLDIHYKKMLSEGKNKKVSVQIPVNLRKAFPSETVRNFVLCLRAQLDPREEKYSFEEILSAASEQLREVNKAEILRSMVSKNLKMETQVARFLPLPVKNAAIGLGFRVTAEKSTSTLISNLGPISFPEDMAEHIERCFLYTGPGFVNGARCGVASFGDKLCFTFSNCYKEGDIEREFFSRLTQMGVDVVVETNRKAEALRWSQLFRIGDMNAYSDKCFVPDKNERAVFPTDEATDRKEHLSRVFHV